MATKYVIRNGNIGIAVNKLQGYLNIMQNQGRISNRVTQDGIFGNDTRQSVLQFQRYKNLLVDGIVGENTWDALIDDLNDLQLYPTIPVASRSYYHDVGENGLDIYKLQDYLNQISSMYNLPVLSVDGIYGSNTKATVRKYQQEKSLVADGLLGATTWDNIMNDYLRNN